MITGYIIPLGMVFIYGILTLMQYIPIAMIILFKPVEGIALPLSPAILIALALCISLLGIIGTRIYNKVADYIIDKYEEHGIK